MITMEGWGMVQKACLYSVKSAETEVIHYEINYTYQEPH